MAYVNIKTKKVLTPFEVRAENPNVSFPNGAWDDKLLSSLGYAELKYPSEHKKPTLYEKLIEGEPVKKSDGWYRSFTIDPMTKEEKEILILTKWAEVRTNRDAALASSDWTQLEDSTVNNKQAWTEYRQKLRDVTKVDDPHDVVWPLPPIN